MPPVINTYGCKKKRRGLLKYIRQDDTETHDLFDALNIDKIKVTKALVDEKKRKKAKKDSKGKTQVTKASYDNTADLAFDKLLEKPTWNETLNSSGSSSSSSSYTEKQDEKTCKTEKGNKWDFRSHKTSSSEDAVLTEVQNGRKKSAIRKLKKSSEKENRGIPSSKNLKAGASRLRIRKKTGFKEDSMFQTTLSDSETDCIKKKALKARSYQLSKVDICEILHLRPGVAKPCSPISPIYPVRGTSTPCKIDQEIFGKFRKMIPEYSPFSVVLHESTEVADSENPKDKEVNGSVDLFSSYEHNVGLQVGGEPSIVDVTGTEWNKPKPTTRCSDPQDSFGSPYTISSFNKQGISQVNDDSVVILTGALSSKLTMTRLNFKSDYSFTKDDSECGVNASVTSVGYQENMCNSSMTSAKAIVSTKDCSSSDEMSFAPLPSEVPAGCAVPENGLRDCRVVLSRCDQRELSHHSSNFIESKVEGDGHSECGHSSQCHSYEENMTDCSQPSEGSEIVQCHSCGENMTGCLQPFEVCKIVQCHSCREDKTDCPQHSEGLEIVQCHSCGENMTDCSQPFEGSDIVQSHSYGEDKTDCPQHSEVSGISVDRGCLAVLKRCDSKESSLAADNSFAKSCSSSGSQVNHNDSQDLFEDSTNKLTSDLNSLKLEPLPFNGSSLCATCLNDSLVDDDNVQLQPVSVVKTALLKECDAVQLFPPANCTGWSAVSNKRIVTPLNQLPVCQVVLHQCDQGELHSTTANSDHLGKPLVSLDLAQDSSVSARNLRLSEATRFSMNRESIVLKPGKQWRRSLSILSQIRTSDGVRKSIVDTRCKGKSWQSSVQSLLQMQPHSVLKEESEESSLLHYDSSVEICDASSRLDSSPRKVTEKSNGASEVFRRCGQTGPLPFEHCYPESMKKKCRKIGEGVYGEVFLLSGGRNRTQSVIKIIPIEGHLEVNGEPQKTFGEILSEVCVAQELSNLRQGSENVAFTFNQVEAIRCVQGCYPEWLLDLWNDYNDLKGSENDCPEMFHEDQQYLVLELSHGGIDLESFVFSSAEQGLAAFKQVALTLAVGEKALHFEHRDLHWGNILISKTKKKEVNFSLNGEPISALSKGIQVSIIDFTMSRIDDPITGGPVYFDLSKDETLFTAQGDYQFEVYRIMKDCCRNQWDNFTPMTNVAWLYYLSDKLCTMARYRNRSSREHAKALQVLHQMKDALFSYTSVMHFVSENMESLVQ